MPRKDYHQVLDTRTCACGCGRRFDVTSRRKNQRFALAQCVNDLRARSTEIMRVRTTLAFRRTKFGAWIAARAQDGKLTEAALLEVMAEAYSNGYHSGYNRARLAAQRERRYRRVA